MTKSRKYPIEPLTTNEVQSLLNACPITFYGLRNRALIIVLWRGGLRIAEALSLNTRDIDNGTIRIHHGKGDKPRIVAIDDLYRPHVQTWIERRGAITGPLFCTRKGKPLSTAYVRSLFKRIGKQAGISKRVHPHCLRHTFAFDLANERKDIRVIQQALGHSSLSETDRYVNHLNPVAVIDALSHRA